jgi:diaminopimelate decarboxylase
VNQEAKVLDSMAKETKVDVVASVKKLLLKHHEQTLRSITELGEMVVENCGYSNDTVSHIVEKRVHLQSGYILVLQMANHGLGVAFVLS